MVAAPVSKEEAKRVILEIVRQSPGDAVKGKARIFKAFYFAHLYYAAEHFGYLTEWPIVKMEHGPGIHDFASLVSELVQEESLQAIPIKVGPYKSTKYRAVEQTQRQHGFSPDELAAIKAAAEFVADKTSAQLSEITHEYSRSWNSAQLGDELRIYIDLLTDDDYSSMQKSSAKLDGEIAEIWG
ncbi:MAG: hypothetical protein A2W31_01035 [Planctomycetes bacterium RBG_16_64_10]|nr:MAG: hypothetical protein A2W31_01035 [Planctomycetes bacterium RBG_16_64_10]